MPKSPSRKLLPKRIVRACAIVLGALILLALWLAWTPAAREFVLGELISQANRRLPGELRVQSVRWPHPAKIEADGVEWTDRGDTLLAVRSLALSLRPASLMRRDIVVNAFEIDGVRLDIPRVSRALGPSTNDGASGGSGPPLLRAGSVPGFPSLAIARLTISDTSIRASESLRWEEVELRASVEARRDHRPRLRIEALRAREAEHDLAFETDDAELGPSADSLRVDARARLGSESWRLILSPAPGGALRLRLQQEGGEPPPDGAGLALAGRLERDEQQRPSGVGFEGTFRLPGIGQLARIEPLCSSLAGWPDLDGPRGAIVGSFGWREGTVPTVRIELDANDWMRGGRVSVRGVDGAAVVDTAELHLDGLDLAGSLRLDDDITGTLRAELRSARWLGTLRPGGTLPDRLAGTVSAVVDGPADAPGFVLIANGRASVGEARIDSLGLRARRASGGGAIEVEVALASGDVTATTIGEIDLAGEPSLRIAPIRIQLAEANPKKQSVGDLAGSIRTSSDGEVAFRNVRVTGDLGELALNGTIEAGGSGRADVEAKWPQPPPVLLRSLSPSAAARARLISHWKRDGIPRLQAHAVWSPMQEGARGSVKGTFDLPGPRGFSALLPDSVRVEDLGPLRGEFEIAAKTSGPEFTLSADLGRTEWITAGAARLRGEGEIVTIDTLFVAADGIAVTLAGRGTAGQWDLDGLVELPDAALVRRFAPAAPTELDLEALARVRLRSVAARPELQATLEARASAPRLSVPRIEGDAQWSPRGLAVVMRAPEGAVRDGLRLEELSASFDRGPEGSGPWPAIVRVEARAPQFRIAQRSRVTQEAGFEVVTDTLTIEVGGRTLVAARPFRVQIAPELTSVRVETLELRGSLGSISGDARLEPQRPELKADARLRLPVRALAELSPSVPWPESLQVALELAADGAFSARGELEGVPFADRRFGARFDLSGALESAGVGGSVGVHDSAGTLLDAQLALPVSISAKPAAASWTEGPLRLDAELRRFPLPSGAAGSSPASPMTLDGRLAIRGSPSAPSAHLAAEVSFPAGTQLANHRIELVAWHTPAGGLDSSLASAAGDPPPAAGDVGLSGSLALDRGERRILNARAHYPALASLVPLALTTKRDAPMRATIDSEEIPLDEFDQLLPADVGLEGVARVHLDVEGAPEDPRIEGRLTSSALRVYLSDGTRVGAHGEIRLGGTALRPQAKGRIEVEHGVIRIPDSPKDLHPTEGSALLWGSLPAEADSGGVTEPPAGAPADSTPPRPIDLDVDVEIPSGLWIRGQGLDVELSGRLRVIQRGATPTIVGELKAVQGTFLFLGRRLAVEEGRVTFYGDDELNPSLDLVLLGRVNDTTIRVSITGTTESPELAISSEPEMEEGDIMSLLVFGRTLEGLDSGQVGLLQQRSRELAAAFGTARLQSGLSRQLKVDLLTITESSGGGGESALVVGKYLNPRALLKYERALAQEAITVINLEYLLTRHLKLETLYSRELQSGLELNWTADY